MARPLSRSLIADVGLLYAAAVWGTTFSVVKGSLDAVDPLVLVGYRFLLAAALLGLGLWVAKVPIRASLREGVGLGVLLWLLYVPQTIGLNYTTASNSAFITGLFIVFVPVCGFALFRTRPTRARVAAVVVALAGLWLLTGGMRSFGFGDAITLLTALAYALHILFADRWVNRECDPWALSFLQFAVVGLLSVVVAPCAGASFEVRRTGTMEAIAFLALFPTLSAFVIQMLAQRIAGPVKVALIFAMEPVCAAAYAWTIGGERVIPLHAAGGALIVAAIGISGAADARAAQGARAATSTEAFVAGS